jgi:hypothetical protein
LSAEEQAVAQFFGSLSASEFMLRVDEAWTPAEQLAHLNSAVSAVARGFGISRLVLRIRFGASRRESRTFDALRDDYLTRLAGGGRASGGFVPPREDLGDEQSLVRQRELLGRWQRVNGRLQAALRGWREPQLDRIQLPHPILGKITAREMLFFTIYHDGHHVKATKRRLPRFAGTNA